MPICATVLKSGGEFTVEHLQHFVDEFRLFTQRWTRRNNFVPPRLVCLTDLDPATLPAGVEAIPMVDAWDEPWTVLELFKPGLFADSEAVLYFRLDVDLVGDFLDVFDAVDALEITRLRSDTGDELALGPMESAAVAEVYAGADDLTVAITEAATVDTAAFGVAVDDDATLATDEAAAAAAALAGSDAIGLADAVAGLEVTVALTEAAILSLAEAVRKAAALAVSDAPTVSFVAMAALTALRAVSDSPTISLVEGTAALKVARALSDIPSAGLTEVKTLLALLARADNPTLTVTEAKTILARLSRTDNPTLTLTEAKTILATLARTDNPTAAISEASTLVQIGGGPDIGAWEYIP